MTHLHEVVITAIVVKDGRYLLRHRAFTRKRFPGRWSVPGGRLEEVRSYDLIDGILDELALAEKARLGRGGREWSRAG